MKLSKQAFCIYLRIYCMSHFKMYKILLFFQKAAILKFATSGKSYLENYCNKHHCHFLFHDLLDSGNLIKNSLQSWIPLKVKTYCDTF